MKTNTKFNNKQATAAILFMIIPLCGFMWSSVISREQEAENEIKRLIEKESEAWWNKNFEEWSDCWVQDEYVRTMGWWQEGGITVVKGWSERSERTRKLMADYPDPSPQKTIRKDWNIRIMKDMAWVTFIQYGENTSNDRMEMPGISYETRIIEKHNGKWKIAYVGWLLEE
jgi:hypothetical protein